MGVLRMLGMTRYGAIILILMQAYAPPGQLVFCYGLITTLSYFYAIPGYALGLILAGIVYYAITIVFQRLLYVSLPATLSGLAIGIATSAYPCRSVSALCMLPCLRCVVRSDRKRFCI